jgi:hypothetical protein
MNHSQTFQTVSSSVIVTVTYGVQNLETHKLRAGTVTSQLSKYTNNLQIPVVQDTSQLLSLSSKNVPTLHCLHCSKGADNTFMTKELAHSSTASAISPCCMPAPKIPWTKSLHLDSGTPTVKIDVMFNFSAFSTI